MTEEGRNDYRHVLPLQIRFNDVDKFGHVNNTVYFQFRFLTNGARPSPTMKDWKIQSNNLLEDGCYQ